MACVRCGRGDVKVWDDDLCSFCQITENRGLAVVGLAYAVRGRMDRVNPQKDTLRAIEMMAQTKSDISHSEVKSWVAHARTLSDKDCKYDPDSAGEPAPSRGVSPSHQASVRHAEEHIRTFWNECKHDHMVQGGKPKTEIQAGNFRAVEAAKEA